MNDERIEADLAAYVDGELDPASRGEIEQMLEASPRYGQMVAEMRQAKAWLGGLPAIAPPAGAAQLADPTVARLEREALFDTGTATGVSRLMTPGVLAMAAGLVIAATLAITIFVMLPGSDSTQIVRNLPQVVGQDREGATETPPDTSDDQPEGDLPDDTSGTSNVPDGPGVEPLPDPDVPPQMNRSGPTPGEVARGTGETEQPIPMLAVPDLEDDMVLLAIATPQADTAAGRVAGRLAAEGVPFKVRNFGSADERAPLNDALVRRLRRAGLTEDDLDRPMRVFSPEEEMTRLDVTSLLSTATTDTIRPIALWSKGAVGGPRPAVARVQREGNGGDNLWRPGAPEPATPDEQALADAARKIFPNDRLNFFFRRSNPTRDVPLDLPDVVNQLMADGRGRIQVQVDADGYADFSALGLERADVLGIMPRELGEDVQLRLAEEYLVGLDFTVTTASKAEVPGGRTPGALDLLKVDRNPFRAGDAMRVDLEDGRRVEAIVASDGTAELGDLGVVEALDRTAGDVQRDLIEVAGQDEMPPAVVNVSLRRAADLDDTASEKTRVMVLVLEQPDVPATRPATRPTEASTLPATRPG